MGVLLVSPFGEAVFWGGGRMTGAVVTSLGLGAEGVTGVLSLPPTPQYTLTAASGPPHRLRLQKVPPDPNFAILVRKL